MFNVAFPRAVAEERGCGEREPGGVYAESGLSPYGLPIEHFLFDPPLPVPAGLDLVNKPQLWPRIEGGTNEAVRDIETGRPIYDLLIHVGAQHYPYAPDYIEETRRMGASRKLNPNLDLALLTRHSRMLLAHPKAIPANWQDLQPPQSCRKRLKGHALAHGIQQHQRLEKGDVAPERDEERVGPCIFKLWELIPQEVAAAMCEPQPEQEQEGAPRPLCLRQNGSTLYEYRPTGEAVTWWQTGFILALPITGFALIQYADDSVNEKAKAKVVQGLDTNGASAIPFYETPR